MRMFNKVYLYVSIIGLSNKRCKISWPIFQKCLKQNCRKNKNLKAIILFYFNKKSKITEKQNYRKTKLQINPLLNNFNSVIVTKKSNRQLLFLPRQSSMDVPIIWQIWIFYKSSFIQNVSVWKPVGAVRQKS